MKLPSTTIFLLFLIVASTVLVGSFVEAQQNQNVGGILTVDTTWTKANSPYTLTRPISVSQGVTLTIEPGVTVNLGSFYIQVNGTLKAKGTNTQNIHLVGGGNSNSFPIELTEVSQSYNEQTGSGSIIENVVLDATYGGINVHKVSPKIDNNTITAQYGVQLWEGTQTISNNIIYGGVGTHTATGTITGNTIFGTVYAYGIYNVAGQGGYHGPPAGNTIVTNNKIISPSLGQGTGIYCANTVVTGNTISGFETGIVIAGAVTDIEKNLIINNVDGIKINGQDLNFASSYPQFFAAFQCIIKNNMITQNRQGIALREEFTGISNPSVFSLTIANNNIEGNTNYNFYLNSKLSVNIPNNWWGTTDAAAINQTIYDVKYDFNLGAVNVLPALSSPSKDVPNANVVLPTPPASPSPSAPTSPTPTDESTASPTPANGQTTFGLDLFQTLIVALLAGIFVCLIILILVMMRRNRK